MRTTVMPVLAQEYGKLSTEEMVELISGELHASMRSIFHLAVTQLEAARKVEPDNPEVKRVHELVKKMSDAFEQHSGKEERLLFPIINVASGKSFYVDEDDLLEFIEEMKYQHLQQRFDHKQVKMLSRNYNYPHTASPSHKLAYAQLHNLAQDFKRVVFIEEEYLFPRLLQMNVNTFQK